MAADGTPLDDDVMVEEASFDYDRAFDGVKNKSCRVDQVAIIGLQRTKAAIVAREFLRIREARTLEEVKDAVLVTYEDLLGLDIFDAVEIVIDGSKKGERYCNIVARFTEKSVLRVHTGTYVQGTEGSLEVSANLTNPLGRAEQITLSGEWGSQSTILYSVGVTRPRPNGHPIVLDLRLNQLFHNFQRWSSFSELVRGGNLTATTVDGRHAISYELGWYRLSDPTRLASRAVLQQLGDKLKSAVKYVFRYDTFEGGPFPREGWGVSSTTEVAGIGTDPNMLRHLRQRLAWQVALPMGQGASLTLATEAGVLVPWGTRSWSSATNISDRFFVGGLTGTSLRGFLQKGVGPTDVRRPPRDEGDVAVAATTRDSIGGDLFCTMLAAFNFELPFEIAQQAGMYGHLFVNGGNVVGLSGQGSSFRSRWQEFNTSFRWTAGAGIVWPTRIGKLEINMCRVLKSQLHDRVKHGVQIGFTPPPF